MKIVTEKINKDGKRVATVILENDEQLMAFRDERYYQLGGQVNDIVKGHVINGACHVVWCSIGQEWEMQ